MIGLKGKIALAVFGVFIAFLFGELVLRLIGYSSGIYVFDRKTGMSILRPDKSFYWTKECFKNKVTANSAGFNDEEFIEEKKEGVFRIAVLGDSYVEALQVPQEKSFHNLLEERLNKEFAGSGKKFEVYAFGHSGNGTLMNYFYLKNYGLKYKPDLVIDSFLVGNDFRDDSYELAKEYAEQTGDLTVLNTKPFPVFFSDGQINSVATEEFFKKTEGSQKSFARAVFSKSTLATWLYHKYLEVRASMFQKKQLAPSGELKPGSIPLDNQAYLIDYPKMWTDAWEDEEKLLAAQKNLAKKNDSKFLLISLTEGFRVHQDLALRGAFEDKSKFDFDRPEKLLGEIAKRNSFSYFPLLPYFRQKAAQTGEMSIFPCDGHWNETGHAWAADAIFEYLKANPQLLNLK